MNTFTYEFEQLCLVKGLSIYVDGEADVSYRIYPADPSEGIYAPYASDISIGAVVIYGHEPSDSNINLDQTHWLYKAVVEVLKDSEALQYDCEADALA